MGSTALVAQLHSLSTTVAEERSGFDTAGRLPDELFRELSAIGLFRLWLAGAVAISRSCPLERFERDARAAAKHIAMSPAAYINGGKRLLGHDLSTTPF